MHYKKRTAFSDCNSYFSYICPDNKFLVWETSSNNILVDYILDSKIYGECSSAHWIPTQKFHHSPKKAKLSKKQNGKSQLLALGTSKGDIVLFDIIAGNLHTHLESRHSDSINDICYCRQETSLITCSNDKFIAVWDMSSGQLKSKWQVEDGPIVLLCSLDENNLLTANDTFILWWNVAEKSIIKKFPGNSKDIFKLLPVNVDKSLKSCYFLAAYENDSRIDAWSLNSNEVPVASFVTSDEPYDLDISNVSSKEKPLLMAVVTRKGYLNLFEHVLNGNVNQSLHPKTSIEILMEPTSKKPEVASIMSVKVSDDSESCIIAYGSSIDKLFFKHIKIKRPQDFTSESSLSNSVCLEKVSSKKSEQRLSLNGLPTPEKSSKAVKHKDSVCSFQKKNTMFTSDESSSQIPKMPLHRTLPSTSLSRLSSIDRLMIKDSDIQDSENLASLLLRGIKKNDNGLIDNILYNTTDHKLLCNCVQKIPSYTLRYVLEVLNSRLKYQQKSSPLLGKWLKEIFRIHLKYLMNLMQSKEPCTALYSIKNMIEAKKSQETITKLTALRGLLSLQAQIGSSDESDSENETSTD